MPLVKTSISYEHEEFGHQEVSTFQREVEDLDIHDWLWYMVKQTELMGYDVDQLQIILGDKIFKTDL